MPPGRPFEEWAVVDWSAASRPGTGANSVWVAHGRRGPGGALVLSAANPPTRHEAAALLASLVDRALGRGRTLLIGVDFSLGYPAGFVDRLAPGPPGLPPWRRTWQAWTERVVDRPDNANNRFAAAAEVNRRTGVRFFWGRPPGPAPGELSALPPRDVLPEGLAANPLPRLRTTERLVPGLRSGWQLFGQGSVGSQILTGVPRLEAMLAAFGPAIAVWPFETGVGDDPVGRPDRRRARRDGLALRPRVVLAELWPPAFGRGRGHRVPDRAQVEGAVRALAARDPDGWRAWLAPAALRSLGPAERRAVLDEEGWVLGAGTVV